jgi:signal transduction histidine kinase
MRRCCLLGLSIYWLIGALVNIGNSQEQMSLAQVKVFIENFNQQPLSQAAQTQTQAEQALIALSEQDYLLKLELLHKLGRLQFRINKPQKTIDYNQQAIQLAAKFNAQTELAQAWNDLGIGYYFLGDYSKALKAYQQSLKLRQQLGDEQKIGDSYNNIGLIYSKMRSLELALEYYQKSYQQYIGIANQIDIADVLGNIAGIYIDLKNYPKALQYYHEAKAVYEQEASHENLILVNGNLGVVYQEIGRNDQALAYQHEVIEQATALGLTIYLGPAYNNIAAAEISLGNWQRALDFAEKAIEQGQFNGVKSLLASSYHNAAEANLNLGHLDTALRECQLSLTLAEELDDEIQQLDSLKLIAQIYEVSDQHQQALAFYKRFKELTDEVHEQSSKASLEQAQSRFELIKQNNKIEVLEQEKHLQALALEQQRLYNYLWFILVALFISLVVWWANRVSHKKQIADQQRVNDKLAHLDKLKTEFLSATSAQLLEPLQVIIQLSEQSKDQQQGGKTTLIAKSMMTLVNDISDFAKLKNRSIQLNPKLFDIHLLLDELDLTIGSFFNRDKLTYVTDMPDGLPKVYGDKERLMQVLYILLSFASQHTPQGQIKVSARPFNNYVKVSVSDNGQGFDQQTIDKIFVSFDLFDANIDDINLSNFSLAVAKMLVELHGGRITMSSQIGQGTICSFTLPIQAN